jgi:membrane-associated phospholipid phosphatase
MWARVTAAVVIVIIAGAGPARVLGGQHLLSDVLGGYLLGIAWLIVAHRYLVGPDHRIQKEAAWDRAGLERPWYNDVTV